MHKPKLRLKQPISEIYSTVWKVRTYCELFHNERPKPVVNKF